jgi:uncharacterized membrane protein (DUF373 family)
MEKKELGKKVSKYFFFILTVMIGILVVFSIMDFLFSLNSKSLDITESHILLDKILYSIILVELFHLTITYTLKVEIDPRELILIILTAVGRKLIVKDLFLEPPLNTFVVALVLLICVYALKVMPAGQTTTR